MTGRPSEMHPTPAEGDPGRSDQKKHRGADAIPPDVAPSPDPDPEKPVRRMGWPTEDVEDPPPTD